MIDIQLVRDNPDFIKEKSSQKNVKVDIDELLRIDKDRLETLQEVEILRQKRNEISDRMKTSGNSKPDQASIDEGKQIKIELADREELLTKQEADWLELLKAIPNPHTDDVPVGSEEDSVEIKTYGSVDGDAVDHLDYAVKRDWVDFERGAKVAGAKFYFLKGDLALLENAVVQYALELITKKGFTYMTVPHMVNSRTSAGAGFAPRTSEQSDEYFIEGEDLTLIGTAEAPLTGYHADEIIDEANLPLKYVGYSPCYRKEAGTYGKHTRGLFRVHQFNKLEMYAFTTKEQSAQMHEEILAIEEEVWQAMGIPYHVINIASGDLGAPASKKYDIEYWSRVDKKYRELTSCSNCTDFQTRNLNIRVRRKDGTVELVHSLNGTVVSMARTLIAIIEHYQQENGKLGIPTVIQPYMGGRTEL